MQTTPSDEGTVAVPPAVAVSATVPSSATTPPAADHTPRFSIITAVYNPPLDAFEDTARSVLAQLLGDWEWVLVDDCSTDARVLARMAELAAGDPRVRPFRRQRNGGIVAASNDALDRARGEFVALLDHDDVLAPNALSATAAEIDANPDLDYAYSDQDLMTANGRTHAPYFKPSWSPERFRHHMYTTHFSVLRRALAVDVGGFRAGYDGSQDHDLVLRVTERAREIVHVRAVLYHWRAVPGSAAASGDAKPYAWDAGVRAVQDHVDRLGVAASVTKGRTPGLYTVTRKPDTTTSVSIIIPTIGTSGMVWGQHRMMVVDTVKSILSHTEHVDLEFVVVYDRPTPAPVLDALRAITGARIRLVEFLEPFNFSAKCNVGALHASGDVLLFLNDDIEAKSPEVIGQLLAPLNEPGVGATGPKLLFSSSRIQHAGVTYGSGTISHSYYKASHPGTMGAYGELWMNREVTALTGACIAVRREVFDKVGGFSEALPVNYNDVDFCLKIRRLGLRLLWLHQTVLFHFESISRSSEVHDWEKDLISRRWGNYRGVRETYSNNVR